MSKNTGAQRLLPALIATAVALVAVLAPSLTLAQVWVDGYYRDDGTYVEGHYRSSPDGNPYNNYSFPGNYNPNTGEISEGNPETYLENYYEDESSGSSTGDVWVEGYYRDDGTYVEGHFRTNPDGDPTNNYSYPGNYNPNTGEITGGESSSATPPSIESYAAPPSSGLSSTLVTNIQQALDILGHDPGPIDGVMGPKTRSAVRSFQREVGRTVDGVVDQGTIDWLIFRLKLQSVSSGPSN